MKLQTLLLGAALVWGGVSAHADNVDESIQLTGDLQSLMTAGLSEPGGTAVNHVVSGAFTDTFTFDYSSAGSINLSLNASSSLNTLSTQQIVFTGITIDGVAQTVAPSFAFGGTSFQFENVTQSVAANEPLTIVISGYAGLLGSTGQQISASYSGTVYAAASPVPEPQSWAMMFAGLGVVGWVAGRKQRV